MSKSNLSMQVIYNRMHFKSHLHAFNLVFNDLCMCFAVFDVSSFKVTFFIFSLKYGTPCLAE